MANNTMTLALDGDVPFSVFTRAMVSFNSLVETLSGELDVRQDVRWFVDALEKSSAIATMRGEADVPAKVERVVEGFSQIGGALEAGTPLPYPPTTARHATAIAGVLGGNVKPVRFETAQEEYVVTAPLSTRVIRLRPAHGAIEGRIQTLTNRATLRFTLYDTLYDRAVSCYLEEGREDVMREAWGRQSIVEGLVTREESGRPIAIRRVSDIRMLRETEGDYRDARGVVPLAEDAASPEDVIRRLRDG